MFLELDTILKIENYGFMKIFSYLSNFVLFRILISWVIKYMDFIIPSKHIRETETLTAFFHPKPSYKIHIIIMPKKPYRSLSNLESENKELLSDLIGMVKDLINEFRLEDKGYRLITNGGKYQNIKYLHFHLVSDE